VNTPHSDLALTRALAALGELRIVPLAAAALEPKVGDVGRALRTAVLTEVPAFSASANPEVLPELERHARDHLEEVQRLLRGGTVGDFNFVKAHARRRAEERFPLEAMLHAYRCGHKVISGWIRAAAILNRRARAERIVSAVADFSLDYTNAISTIVATEYVTHARTIAGAEGDQRADLLNALLSGYDEADGRVARLLRRAGYLEARQAFCVVLARSVDPLEMENPARAQRIADAMSGAVALPPIRTLVGTRSHIVTSVFSGTRRLSGWTAPQADLAAQLHPRLLELGPSVLIGVSSDQPSTAFIPRALHEATVALDFASVSDRVVQFSALPLRRLLVHRGGDYLQSALPLWAGALVDADTKAHGTLLQTLRAYADADMNVQKTAHSLRVHPNTVYGRLQRVRDVTSLDGQRYHDLTELLLAADCRRGQSHGR
jgi:hypothetical protein